MKTSTGLDYNHFQAFIYRSRVPTRGKIWQSCIVIDYSEFIRIKLWYTLRF